MSQAGAEIGFSVMDVWREANVKYWHYMYY